MSQPRKQATVVPRIHQRLYGNWCGTLSNTSKIEWWAGTPERQHAQARKWLASMRKKHNEHKK